MGRIGNMLLAWIFLLSGITVVIPSADAWAQKTIAVLLFSHEGRYIEGQQGMIDALKAQGFKEPDVRFVMMNASGSKVRAADLVRKLAAEKPDLILSLGTSGTLIAAKEIRNIPIVFAVLYDPVEAGIAQGWKSSGNNTTGTSPKVPMDAVIARLKEVVSVKKLAVIYTMGEKNSESQLRDLQRTQAAFGFTVVPVPLSDKAEVAEMLPMVLRSSDALYITGSNLIDSQMPLIIESANKAKKVTVTHLEDLVSKGALLGVCSNPYAGGFLAGEKAARILKGAKPSSIPIETIKKLDLIINVKTARNVGLDLSPEFMKKVARQVE